LETFEVAQNGLPRVGFGLLERFAKCVTTLEGRYAHKVNTFLVLLKDNGILVGFGFHIIVLNEYWNNFRLSDF